MILSFSCDLVILFTFDFLLTSCPQMYIHFIVSSFDIFVHCIFILRHFDVEFKYIFLLKVQFMKDIFFSYTLSLLNTLFTQFTIEFCFLPFLTFNSQLFWQVYSFNKSFCLVLSSANLEFYRYFFIKTDLDRIKFAFVHYDCFLLFTFDIFYLWKF